VQLTRKIRVYPTKDQERTLWVLSEQCRLLYNFALDERKDVWEHDQKPITYNEQQNKLPAIKKEFPNYTQVNSKVLQMVLRTLDANYRSFFALIKQDPSARTPKFRGKRYFFTLKFNQSGYKMGDKTITLSHKVPESGALCFDIPDIFTFTKVKQVDVFQDDGKWYLSIVDEIVPPKYQDNGLYQAWDLGITKQTGVNVQGKFTEIRNIRPDKYWSKPVSELMSRRDHCKVNSNGRKLYNNLKRKCERKCRNQIKDFQHKASLMIVRNTKANTIVVGDLDVKRMPKSRQTNRGLNRSTQGTGYLARFIEFLTYKAERAGKKVIEISERNSTQQCCRCGKLHKMTLKDRVMNCDCGNLIDRDRNSSVNIMGKFLSQNALWTGYQQFAGNMRKTGLDISSTLA
jgi:putative transposase